MERTRRSILDRAHILRIKCDLESVNNEFSEFDLNILLKFYPIEGKLCINRMQKNHSVRGVYSKAQRLGLKGPDQSYSQQEIDILTKYYPLEGRIGCAIRLNRSPYSVYMTASRLGLKCTNLNLSNQPRKVLCIETGEIFESLKDAANAKNCLSSTICAVCKNAGKKTAGGYHWKYIEEDEN